MRTSNFLNLNVWVWNEKNSFCITDKVLSFSATLSKNDPHERITLGLAIHSKAIEDTQIGFFKERYVVLVELYDASQKKVRDTILYDAIPLEYKGFDIQGLNRDRKDNHADMEIEVELFNRMDEYTYKTFHDVYKDKTYKSVFSKVRNSWRSAFVLEKEVDKPYGNKKQEQFFIPEMRWHDIIPYVMNKGYAKANEPSTYFFTTLGLCMYRLEESKKRKKIKTVIFPEVRSQVKDFDEIFVTDFSLTRTPKNRLFTGKKQRIFETSLEKKKISVPHREDPKFKKQIWLPKYFKEPELRCIEGFEQYHESINVRNSFSDGIRTTHSLNLTITRWGKFEHFYPLRHIFQVSYSGMGLKELDDEFFVKIYTLTIERHRNELVPKVELTLDVVDTK